MDVEAGDLDAIDDQGSMEKLTPVEDAEGEAIDLDDGVVHVEVVGIELEAGAGDLEAAEEGGVELVELDAAIEAGAEGLDDFGFEDGAGAMEENVGGDDGCDEQDDADGDDPEENGEEGAMTARECREGRSRVGWMGHIGLLLRLDVGNMPGCSSPSILCRCGVTQEAAEKVLGFEGDKAAGAKARPRLGLLRHE